MLITCDDEVKHQRIPREERSPACMCGTAWRRAATGTSFAPDALWCTLNRPPKSTPPFFNIHSTIPTPKTITQHNFWRKKNTLSGSSELAGMKQMVKVGTATKILGGYETKWLAQTLKGPTQIRAIIFQEIFETKRHKYLLLGCRQLSL